jgi:hypothetical protein
VSGFLIPAAVFLHAIREAEREPRYYPPMPQYVPRPLVPGVLVVNACTEEEIAHNAAICALTPPGPNDHATFASLHAATEPSVR